MVRVSAPRRYRVAHAEGIHVERSVPLSENADERGTASRENREGRARGRSAVKRKTKISSRRKEEIFNAVCYLFFCLTERELCFDNNVFPMKTSCCYVMRLFITTVSNCGRTNACFPFCLFCAPVHSICFNTKNWFTPI